MRFPIPQEKWTNAGFKWLSWTGQAYHNGEDINTASGNNDRGEPIFCHDFGTVHKIDQALGGYGKQVIVQHADYFSRYAHLDTFLVKEGDHVTPYTQIGTMGTTGASSSAHLHFELPTSKLISYLKSVRPLDWFRFYPNGYSKRWVTEHYLNPNTNCTRTIRLLNIFYDTLRPTGLQYLQQLKDWVYNTSQTQVKLEIDSIDLKPRINPIPWVTTTFRGGVVGKMIDQSWLRYWILAYGSNYDVVALHLKESHWQGGDVVAYSPVPKQLGIQPIVSRCMEWQDSRYTDLANGDAFIGQLRHELLHTLFSACGQEAIDPVHILEPMGKLADCFTTLRLHKFQGFIPKEGLRMFNYGGQDTQMIPFSGVPVMGKVYRTTDYRMFFLFEGQFRQITESEFEAAVKSGHQWGQMAISEGNQIIKDIGGTFPEFIGTSIRDQIAVGIERQNILTKAGWKTTIPTGHLKD